VIPAFCEEDRLERTAREALAAARNTLEEFEIIIVDDGSTDGTSDIADRLACALKCVSVVHFPENRGVGAAYQAGLARARYSKISLVPGDHAFEQSGLEAVFRAAGTADMVISYRCNPAARSPIRRLLSVICNQLLRLTTRCPLRDGHSLYVWPVDLARQVQTPPDYSYHLVTLVSLLRRVKSYTEVPVCLTPKPDAHSRVLRWRVVWTLGWRLSNLLIQSLLDGRRQAARCMDLVTR
jgi:dolichol-phosphate mannosyltransferase